MKRSWYGLVGGLCLFGLLWAGWSYFGAPRRANVLLITLDTTRADRLGCYGYDLADTPRLDELAQQGVLFERAYAPAPMTSPSHTSMMTGLWPPEHGVITNALVSLETDIPTVAELFQQRGYRTAAFPAATMLQAKYGLNRGFQEYFDDFTDPRLGVDQKHRYRHGQSIADLATQWLKRQLQQSSPAPVFCWVHFYDPHDPYLPHPKEFGNKFDERLYDGELAYVDRQIGRLLDELQNLAARSNTIIVVAGDHGEGLGDHGENAHGYLLHDATLRVPLIIVDPRRNSLSRRVSTPVSLVDLFPTLLEAGGIQRPSESMGRSLLPALTGASLEPRVCYSQTEEPYLQAFWSPLSAITTERWRYVRTTRPELYDLQADPRELTNLAEQLPDQVSVLDGELAALESTFQRRSGKRITVSAQEQRALESMGYTGGPAAQDDAAKSTIRPDVKDMIGYLNEFHQAAHLIDEEKFAEAALILEPLARDVPDFLRARLNLAQCRIHQENYADAIHWSESALEIDEHSERAYHLRGYACLKSRDLEQAEQSFQRQLELNPDSEDGHLYLAEVYQRQEKFLLAIEHYEAVLRINPHNEFARQPLAALRQALGSPR